MPPNSTQNLNAKLSAIAAEPRRGGGIDLGFGPSPIQSSTPPVQIVGVADRYRGGYHLGGV